MKGVTPIHFVVTVFVDGQNNSQRYCGWSRIMVNCKVTVRNGLQQKCNLGESLTHSDNLCSIESVGVTPVPLL